MKQLAFTFTGCSVSLQSSKLPAASCSGQKFVHFPVHLKRGTPNSSTAGMLQTAAA